MHTKNETWSIDNKDFRYASLDELITREKGLLKVGDKVFVGIEHKPVLGDLCDADDIIHVIQREGDAICSECSVDLMRDIDDDAKRELDGLLHVWMSKHVDMAIFSKINTVREHVLTAEDMMV